MRFFQCTLTFDRCTPRFHNSQRFSLYREMLIKDVMVVHELGSLPPGDSRLFYHQLYSTTMGQQEAVWGPPPAPLVLQVTGALDLRGTLVLDIGSGEGKNANELEKAGARVVAIEYSPAALSKAAARWGNSVKWLRADAGKLPIRPSDPSRPGPFALVVLAGLLHCCPTPEMAVSMVRQAQLLTKPDGLHLVSSFNDRRQDGLELAHAGARHWIPTHEELLKLYSGQGWYVVRDSVDDYEVVFPHPPDFTHHTHSITRFIARSPQLGPRVWDRSQWDDLLDNLRGPIDWTPGPTH